MRDLYVEHESRLPFGIAAAAAAILLLLASVSDVRAGDEDMRPAATITIVHGGRTLAGSGPQHGALFFRGRVRAFSIAGLGIGGTGGADPAVRGRLYHLRAASYFPGDYTIMKSPRLRESGRLWLENREGVVLELEPQSDTGAIALGAGSVTIAFR